MATTAELFDLAQRYHQSGDLARAEPLYGQVLQADPGHADALHFLGILAQQSGRLQAAGDLIRQAIALKPSVADFHNNLGVLHKDQGKLAEAIDCYRQALAINPGHVVALDNLGSALKDQGKLDEAGACHRQALHIDPNYADAHYNLGRVFQEQGMLAEASACYRQALAINPNHVGALNNLGVALLEQGQGEEAIACYRQALSINPNQPVTLNNLGIVLYGQKQAAQAAECYQQALRINSNYADAHNNLGLALVGLGQLGPAINCFRQALQINPNHADAHLNLGNALKDVGKPVEAMACYRQALQINPNLAAAHNNLGVALFGQGRLFEAIDSFRKALGIDPDHADAHNNLVFSLLYHPHYDCRGLFEELGRWEQKHAQSLAPLDPSFGNDPSPERRLRIGYVSPDFRDHALGRNIWPLLRNHDHQQFEITLYAHLPKADAMTLQFRQCADHWRDVAFLPDEQVADKIKQDGIDILVDLTMHMGGNRLLIFARKPAPVQVTFAGYPGTTGLKTIDYRLTDPYLDPPGLFEAWYSEATYRLPHSFWCYDPWVSADGERRGVSPPVAPLPALAKGSITFGCLNNFCKINEEVLQLWAQVLRAVKGSCLRLLAKEESPRQPTLAFLARHGISSERIEFCSFRPRPEYLALYHGVDIGLDTFPYNGHTTSLDSFWMGVPVITLVGKTVVGRGGLSQLTNLGLEELAATTPEDFVRLAVNLAGDLPRLTALRTGLRDRMKQSPLMDAKGFARGIEEAYRYIWRKWCGDNSLRFRI